VTSDASPNPDRRRIQRRWRDLGLRRRWDLVARGRRPRDTDEAITMLGYARQLLHRSQIWAYVAALGAFALVLALELVVGGDIDGGSFVLAGGIAVGVGLGLELGGRYQARRLHRRAEAALAESDGS
jgi:hypothetical protein